jgi:hypothetical protein
LNRFCVLQRTAWFPSIGESAASAAEEEALQSLSREQAAHVLAQRKQQVLSELRQRLATMTGKLHDAKAVRALPALGMVDELGASDMD